MALLSITITVLGSSGGAAGGVAGVRALRRRRRAQDDDGQGGGRGRGGRAAGIAEGMVRGGITGIVQSVLSALDWGGRHAGRGVVAAGRGARRAAPHVRRAGGRALGGSVRAKRWVGERLRERREARQITAANTPPELSAGGPVQVSEHVRGGHTVRAHSRGTPGAGGDGGSPS